VKKINPLLLIILFLGGMLVAGFCFAQGGGATVSPTNFEIDANPGEIKPNTIKVYNPTDNIVTIKMSVEDFHPLGEEGGVAVEPGADTTYSLKAWVTISPSEFILQPKEEKFVEFTIKIPENAEPGGKWGSILASPTTVSGGEGVIGATIAPSTGTLVLLRISGEVFEELLVKEFSADQSFFEKGPVSFSIRFENTGTVHLKPRGFVRITNWRGKVTDIGFPQQNVIPGSIRKIEAKWQKEWLFGKYTAMVVGSYGDKNLPFISSVLTFWAFPWRIGLGILIVLIIVLLFFYKTRKRWQLALRILFKGEQK